MSPNFYFKKSEVWYKNFFFFLKVGCDIIKLLAS